MQACRPAAVLLGQSPAACQDVDNFFFEMSLLDDGVDLVIVFNKRRTNTCSMF